MYCSNAFIKKLLWGSGKCGCKRPHFFPVLISLFISSSVILSGCKDDSKDEGTRKKIADSSYMNSLEEEDPALSLVQNEFTISPKIVLNQDGYQVGAEKTILFIGKTFPETFEIRRIEDDSVAFTGSIGASKHSDELDREVAFATFTDFQSEGDYYVYADTLGDSCAFSIRNDAYDILYKQASKSVYYSRCGTDFGEDEERDSRKLKDGCHTNEAFTKEDNSVKKNVSGGWHTDSKGNRDVRTGCRILNNMLLSYELNSGAFGDDAGIKETGNGIPDILDEAFYEAKWLLKMQDAVSGKVYESAITDGEKIVLIPFNENTAMECAGSLAWFSNLYRKYNAQFADECLSAAKKAFLSVDASSKNIEEETRFFAAVELYRITGDGAYSSVINPFLKRSDYYQRIMENDEIFLGDICYLMTSQKVNKKVCAKIINALMVEAEKVATATKTSEFKTSVKNLDAQKLLNNVRCMVVTEHILSSNEYTKILEDQLHYILGRNELGVNLVQTDSEFSYKNLKDYELLGVMDNLYLNSEFLVLLGTMRR
ncbi:glycoside hydrolase family 9 protein [Butyrivibrio sp. NC3005]|uniref:glycoside hydrolase family 9 protein n=1 Tax=Butyrivibrio sp. NC3005 TaxID=1280685 RepID=UPI0003FA4100|nr:glycoside hydrolase family 9 protein [Butyrivibrio sp. NC3005]